MENTAQKTRQAQLKKKQCLCSELSDEELKLFAKRIKPVCRFIDGRFNYLLREPDLEGLYWITPISVNQPIFFDPQPIKPVEGLQYLCSADTFHSYGYFGVPRPTIKDVLCQLPVSVREKAVAFEVVLPALDWSVVDGRPQKHVLLTHFFAGQLPEEIAAQEVLTAL